MDGQNLYKAYFVPNSTDPEGTIVPIAIGIGVGIGIFISPEIVNAPGPDDPLYSPVGPIGSDPELILIGGAIGAGVGIGVQCCLSRAAAAELAAMRAEFAKMMENKLAWERIIDSQKPGTLQNLARLEAQQLEARLGALAKQIAEFGKGLCK